MARFVEIRKRIESSVEALYPKTSSTVVFYDDGRSVSEVLSSILTDLVTIKNMLGIAGNVYALDEKGSRIPDDTNSEDYVIDLPTEAATSATIYMQDTSGTTLNDGASSNLVSLDTVRVTSS